MAMYEVFIPAAMASEFNVTLKVDADNWMAALKSGLLRLGEKGTQVTNIMVDIMEDNSIHVSDMASGRVFRIKELEVAPVAPAPIPLSAPAPIPLATPAPKPVAPEATTLHDMQPIEEPVIPAPAPVARLSEPPAPKPAAAPAPKPVPVAAARPAKPVSAKPAEVPAAKPVPAPKPAAAKPSEAPTPKPVAKQAPVAAQPAKTRPSAEASKVEQIAAPTSPISGPIGRSRTQTQLEDVFSDLFERTQDIYGMEREEALSFLLDLAMEKIPSDAGSVFVADLASSDLSLLAARGPKAKELEKMRLRVPMGVGIVGFCAQEAVSVAISDTQRDPRFYREVSEKIGYPSNSILCAPMMSGGRNFGCLEVINKKGSSHFTDSELAILGYVAHQGARFLEQA